MNGLLAIVTGGSGDIGSEVGRELVRRGASVALLDLESSSGALVASEHPDKMKFFACDVSNEASVQHCVTNIFEAFNTTRIDCVVNNAAAFVYGKIESVSSSDWDKCLSVNVKGYALVAKHCIPYMKRRPDSDRTTSIINISSISAFLGQPAFTPYNTSKGAITSLTRSMAFDYGPDGVRVNAVAPGMIETSATAKHAALLGVSTAEVIAEQTRRQMLPYCGKPVDVAYMCAFLANPVESRYCTGQTYFVDGGWVGYH